MLYCSCAPQELYTKGILTEVLEPIMGRALDGSDVFFATGVTHLQKCRAPNACDIYATS